MRPPVAATGPPAPEQVELALLGQTVPSSTDAPASPAVALYTAATLILQQLSEREQRRVCMVGGSVIGPAAHQQCVGREALFGAASPRATMVFMRVLRKSSYFSRFQVRDVTVAAWYFWTHGRHTPLRCTLPRPL